jgi:hypothetical protein
MDGRRQFIKKVFGFTTILGIWLHPLFAKEEFPMKDLLSDKVFFAHTVNGVALPEKHGYPLRVVAEGYNGDDWVKYVYEMEVV